MVSEILSRAFVTLPPVSRVWCVPTAECRSLVPFFLAFGTVWFFNKLQKQKKQYITAVDSRSKQWETSEDFYYKCLKAMLDLFGIGWIV